MYKIEKMLLLSATILFTSSITGTLAWGSSSLSTLSQTRTTTSTLFMSSSTSTSNTNGGSNKINRNSNIVLRPSTDNPNAFDSLKIGSPRVHRYTRDASVPTSEAEYVMWYHGRSQTFDDEFNNSDGSSGGGKMLPPLSTGRIGRAFSKNGLHWEKSTTEPLGASAAEDVSDVSLGLNTDSWWSFDTAHVGLGQVLLPMSNPVVITEGGVYQMYYMGGNFEETDLTAYMESENPDMEGKKITGMKMKIGVALSQDGKAWGRIEGDDPSGAVMVPYDKSDSSQALNFDDSSASIWKVEEELYCAWPDVYVNMKAKSGESAFTMYYSTMTKNSKEKVIARAVSEDGFRWFKRGICLHTGANDSKTDEFDSTLDAAGCSRCTVYKQIDFDESKGEWEIIPKKNAPWIMYYEGVSSVDGKHRILKAVSDDGITWVKKGILFDVGDGDDAWDAKAVGTPHISRMDDGTVRMYYTGTAIDGSTAIGARNAHRARATFHVFCLVWA